MPGCAIQTRDDAKGPRVEGTRKFDCAARPWSGGADNTALAPLSRSIEVATTVREWTKAASTRSRSGYAWWLRLLAGDYVASCSAYASMPTHEHTRFRSP